MRSIDLLRVIYQIYFTKKPDIDFIQRSGLLAVKIGQVHALRLDFLSEDVCRELSKLYRHTNNIPVEDIQELIKINTPADFMNNFQSFDDKPLASASVGQVHRAVLATGECVAVKIIKKDFATSFTKDVRSAQKLFSFFITFYPKLKGVANPVQLLGGIEKTTLAELDLRNEMAGQDELKKIYEDNKNTFDLSHLAFAKIYENLSGEKVMVSEFVDALTFDELIDKGEISYETLLELFKIHGFYMFTQGTFHGDIHPGNVLLKDEKIYFVDTGYIGRVTPRLSKNLLQFFKHLADYDYVTCAHYLHEMSEVKISEKEYKDFEVRFIDMYKDFTNTTVSQMSLTKKMMQTIKMGVLSGMFFGDGMFDIIKSLMYMDGMVLRVNPDAILLKDMKQFITKFENFYK